jgi:poly(3-hydroxybutyrate) depolymerase
MPTSVPNKLPAACDAKAAEAAGEKKGTTNDLKLPEFPHQCKIYVPASAAARPAKGAMLWLQSVDEADVEDVIRPWQTICDRDGLLLIVPIAAETGRWERTELEYLRRLIDRVISQYQVDRHRVVVYGQEASVATAWLLGLAGRDVFQGVATTGAPLPRQIRVPQNEPAQRLAIFAAMPSGNDAAAIQMAEGLRKLSDAGYTVTTVAVAPNATRLTDSQREELARWIDTLDRF